MEKMTNKELSQFICDLAFSLSENDFQAEKTERYIDYLMKLDIDNISRTKLLLNALKQQIRKTLTFVQSRTNWGYLEMKERIAKCLNNSINKVDIETTRKAFELYENKVNFSL